MLKVDTRKVRLGVYQAHKTWPRRHLEINGIRPDPANEFGVTVGGEVVFVRIPLKWGTDSSASGAASEASDAG
jgi:hypothetical protein